MDSNSVVPTSEEAPQYGTGDDDLNSTGGDSKEDVIGQLMQLCLSEQPLSDINNNSTSLDLSSGHENGGGDWQEEVYQRIKTMKETYLPGLNQFYPKLVARLQQFDSLLPEQPKSEQLHSKLKICKTDLERMISLLQVSKTKILPGLKDKLDLYEKQMIHYLTTIARLKQPTAAPLQQGQLPQQISQVPSMAQNNMPSAPQFLMQGSVPSVAQNNMSGVAQNNMSSVAQNYLSMAQNYMSMAQNMQVNSLPSLSGAYASQQNINPLQQPGSNLYAAGNINLSSMAQNNLSRIALVQAQAIMARAQANMALAQNNMASMQVNSLPSQRNMNPPLQPGSNLVANAGMNSLPSLQNPLPSPLAASSFVLLFPAKRSREQQELVEEVKKQKVEIQELKQTLVQMQQQIQQQQVKE